MYWFSEGELMNWLICFLDGNQNTTMYWWYRYIIFQAEKRNYLKIVMHSDERPFWYRKFSESIELTESTTQLIEKIKNYKEKQG